MFNFKRRISFYDADPGGILFFAKAFEIAHTAYESMIEDSKLSRNYFFDKDYAIPLLRAGADFLKPIHIGEVISVNVTVSELRDSSFELTYVFLNDAGEKKAKLKTVHLFVDKATFKKVEIPEEFKECLKNNLK